MFELIRANQRKTAVLVFAMLALLLALGFAIGAAVVPPITAFEDPHAPGGAQVQLDPSAGFVGMGVAFFIWMVLSAVSYYQGGRIVLSMHRARRIEQTDHPQLWNVVEEMTIASGLPKMPQVYILDDMALNAFATGRDPDHAAVAVTAGLLGRLNRDQLQGVVAHEVAHIKNRDVLLMTMISIMLGTIVMISELFLRGLWRGAALGGGRRYRSSRSKGGGGAQLVFMVIALVLAILAPILAQLIYFAVSRRREYLADAGAAVFTRYPEGLASALEVLADDTRVLQAANRATAPMYIINPLHPEGKRALNLTSTHPPIEERIHILRSMAGGASYAAYQAAWRKVGGDKAGAVPASGLRQGGGAVRAASADAGTPAMRGQAPVETARPRSRERAAGDIIRNLNNFIFIPCVCGLRLKLPPDFKQDQVQCPRCGRAHTVPVAQLAGAQVLGETLARHGAAGAGAIPMAAARQQPLPPLSIAKKPGEWLSFKCACGAPKNLAPDFLAPETRCNKCGRTIHVQHQP